MWQAGPTPVLSGEGRDLSELAAVLSPSADMNGGESQSPTTHGGSVR